CDSKQITLVLPKEPPTTTSPKTPPKPEFWEWIEKVQQAVDDCEELLRDLGHLEYRRGKVGASAR
ncbi:MAG TPA: hypothetical protein VNH18_07495, partial [Bryobacteraceae bacterium]|nr:hypothetical protein [Bryobacteraceae bacterium]